MQRIATPEERNVINRVCLYYGATALAGVCKCNVRDVVDVVYGLPVSSVYVDAIVDNSRIAYVPKSVGVVS
jgi:hypothetical protein